MYPDFRSRPKRPELQALMRQVESFGVSCELGLVQRHCDAEPLGLFRFGMTPLAGLVIGLNEDFAELTDAPQLSLHVDTVGEWITTHKRYGFEFHTGRLRQDVSEQDVRQQVTVHFRALRRVLLETLRSGEKLFVYRPLTPGPAGDDAAALLAAMRQHGPATLMWVDLAATPELAGRVAWTRPGEIMTGSLAHYADLRFAAGAAFDDWVSIVAGGVSLWQG